MKYYFISLSPRNNISKIKLQTTANSKSEFQIFLNGLELSFLFLFEKTSSVLNLYSLHCVQKHTNRAPQYVCVDFSIKSKDNFLSKRGMIMVFASLAILSISVFSFVKLYVYVGFHALPNLKYYFQRHVCPSFRLCVSVSVRVSECVSVRLSED